MLGFEVSVLGFAVSVLVFVVFVPGFEVSVLSFAVSVLGFVVFLLGSVVGLSPECVVWASAWDLHFERLTSQIKFGSQNASWVPSGSMFLVPQIFK